MTPEQIDQHERDAALEAARMARQARATFDHGRGDARKAMTELCDAFHVLRDAPGVMPFDPEVLARWVNDSGSGGTLAAGAFVLSVWNATGDWKIARHLNGFDLQTAFGTWDRQNRAAFVAWAEEPWWP